MRRILYRIGQFYRARRDAPSSEDLERVSEILPPPLFDLFSQLLPFEQAHAIRVFEGLQAQGFSHPELLIAALLHDVGKARYPLRPWERAFGVLAKRFFPSRLKQWGQGAPNGLQRGIVVAEQHAQWGAEMADLAGASSLVVRLIVHHQDQLSAPLSEEEQMLLKALQQMDEVS